MPQKKEPINILKNKISNMDTEKELLEQKRSNITTFLNCYSYFSFRKNTSIYEKFDSIHCDGIILQKLVKLIGFKAERISFDMTSLAPIVFKYAETKGYKLAIIGSQDSNLNNFIKIVKEKYPQLSVIEKRNGFFNNNRERELYLQKLIDLSPDVVIVGMGAPLQDLFLADLKNKGWNGIGYTCGGFIHQTASKGIKYYPKIINDLNLRWLYRIYDEPKLLKRYVFFYPLSIILFVLDLIRFKMHTV